MKAALRELHSNKELARTWPRVCVVLRGVVPGEGHGVAAAERVPPHRPILVAVAPAGQLLVLADQPQLPVDLVRHRRLEGAHPDRAAAWGGPAAAPAAAPASAPAPPPAPAPTTPSAAL